MSQWGNVHDDNRISDLSSRDPKADTEYVHGKFKPNTRFKNYKPGLIKFVIGLLGIAITFFGDELLNLIFGEDIDMQIIKYVDWMALLFVFIGIIGLQQLVKNIMDV